jgi:hypothetical protein
MERHESTDHCRSRIADLRTLCEAAIAEAPSQCGAMLCSAWNWATCPSVLRSDEAHAMCRRFATWCDQKIVAMGCRYEELSNGARWAE